MKTHNIFLGALGVLSIAYMSLLAYTVFRFQVGDCVRYLGNETVEKITVITPGGAVETIYPDKYNPGQFRRDTYSDTKRFVPAQCPKELQ